MKTFAPHEPNEELLSVDDAFSDARESEARWSALDAERGVKRVFIELPAPLYTTLERLASHQQRRVPNLIERVIEDLVTTFTPSN
jgi:hypothetical protein